MLFFHTNRGHLAFYFRWAIRVVVSVGIAFIITIFAQTNRPYCKNCNVILVSIDTFAAQHMPCYGYTRNTSPNLCKFAMDNVFFENSFSQSPVTPNSHFSIFTSLYPHTHKMVLRNREPLENKYLTLPQIMRTNGYDTIYHAILTDIHLPLNRGLERGFNTIEDGDTVDSWDSAYQQLLSNARNKKPTFLFLHTYDIHTPYITGHQKEHQFTSLPEYPHIPLTTDEFYNINTLEFYHFILPCMQKTYQYEPEMVEKEMAKDRDTVDKLAASDDIGEAKTLYESLSTGIQYACSSLWYSESIDKKDVNQIEYIKALYDERISTMDAKITKLLSLIKNSALKDNTILIITSDHGEEFMEHGALFHGNNIYKTSTQVPLIMYLPHVKPTKITQLVQNIDIFPTVLALVGIQLPPQTQGISLADLILKKSNAPSNTYILSEYGDENVIQYGNWRYYFYSNFSQKERLYNLESDPDEKKNVAGSNKNVIATIKKLSIPH